MTFPEGGEQPLRRRDDLRLRLCRPGDQRPAAPGRWAWSPGQQGRAARAPGDQATPWARASALVATTRV